MTRIGVIGPFLKLQLAAQLIKEKTTLKNDSCRLLCVTARHVTQSFYLKRGPGHGNERRCHIAFNIRNFVNPGDHTKHS